MTSQLTGALRRRRTDKPKFSNGVVARCEAGEPVAAPTQRQWRGRPHGSADGLLLSEQSLASDWLRGEEDAAWKHLQPTAPLLAVPDDDAAGH